MKNAILVSALLTAGTLAPLGMAQAQVAGSTTTAITVTEATQVAMGWSVKKSLMGKTVYNDAGEKIGKVMDLIIDPERNVSFVIVGAGGFIGIGSHDVAIPVQQVQNRNGKLTIPAATKGSIKAMPAFNYSDDTAQRDRFIADVERDMTRARSKLTELKQRAGTATAEAKGAIEQDMDQLQMDLNSTQEKLDDMKRSGAARWHDFESAVNTALAKLRRKLDAV